MHFEPGVLDNSFLVSGMDPALCTSALSRPPRCVKSLPTHNIIIIIITYALLQATVVHCQVTAATTTVRAALSALSLQASAT